MMIEPPPRWSSGRREFAFFRSWIREDEKKIVRELVKTMSFMIREKGKYMFVNSWIIIHSEFNLQHLIFHITYVKSWEKTVLLNWKFSLTLVKYRMIFYPKSSFILTPNGSDHW